ncbi:deoR-like helix-turn-helix domain protein [Desulfosporosinus sp. OT]|nr:DeoR family transcriptional regulator [Desulfosporosinus sp. OT]EGW37436.1 deoR-like helix-turn-helix domain protein [Desulfosporosinus sp. OT]
MFAEERQELILLKLKSFGRVFAKELAEEFQVSIDTIRRDLTSMEENRLLKRTHGVAVPLSKVRRFPMDDRIYTVITNSLIIAGKLQHHSNIKTYIVCGKVKSEEGIVDPLATEFMRTLRLDTAFS